MPKAITISSLSFRYPNQTENLFDKLNLDVDQYARFGLFGPNGAGKTSLINLMTGVLNPLCGELYVSGMVYDCSRKEINSKIGFVPQELSFYEVLTLQENLDYFGACYGMNSGQIKTFSEKVLGILGLSNVQNKKIKYFSGGMKRRVNLAIGVLHNPEILFLDEPTTGVDIQSRNAIIAFLKELNDQGTTLIYTSHLLREAEELCNTVALIDQGKVIVNGALSSIVSDGGAENLEDLFLQLTGKEYRD